MSGMARVLSNTNWDLNLLGWTSSLFWMQKLLTKVHFLTTSRTLWHNEKNQGKKTALCNEELPSVKSPVTQATTERKYVLKKGRQNMRSVGHDTVHCGYGWALHSWNAPILKAKRNLSNNLNRENNSLCEQTYFRLPLSQRVESRATKTEMLTQATQSQTWSLKAFKIIFSPNIQFHTKMHS